MRKVFLSLVWVVFLLVLGVAPLFAQGRGRRDHSSSPEDAQQRMQRGVSMIEELDANKNGMLEADEVTGRRKFMVDMILRRSGITAAYPLPLARIREGMQNASQNPSPGGPPSAPMMPGGQPMPGQPMPGGPWQPGQPMPGGPWQPGQPMPGGPWQPGQPMPGGPWQPGQPMPGGPWQPGQPWPPQPGQPQPGQTPSTPDTTSKAPLVPGFGESQTLKPPPGFDTVTPVAAAATSGSAPAGGSPGSIGAPPSSPWQHGGPPPGPPSGQPFGPSSDASSQDTKRDDDKRFGDYAKGLLQKYDKDQNGVLDKEECAQMSNNPFAADISGDGFVSLDELIAWTAAQNRKTDSRDSRSGRDGRSRRGDSGKSDEGDSKKDVYHLHSSRDRLPEGLPDWFLRKDQDADGQISMAEYADQWTDAKVAEFSKYDLNGDGLITPAECLKMEKPSKR